MSDYTPWEQQEEESVKAYDAFCTYRDMGPQRSQRQVGEQLGKSTVMIEKWAARHHWRARINAYDRHTAAARLAAQERARDEMAERHAQIAMVAQGKLARRLASLDPDKISPRTMFDGIKIATDLERTARGEPTRIEVTGRDGGPIELTTMSDDERREYLHTLQRELAARLHDGPGLDTTRTA